MTEEKDPKDYKANIEELADDLKEYLKTSAELYKMQASAKGAEIGAEAILGIIIMIFISMAFLFASIAAAYGISAWLDKEYSGFLIVAGFYLVIAVVIVMFKNKGMKRSLADKIVNQIYSKEDE